MSKAMVLLSGGIDSATTLAMAVRDCHKVEAVSFEYGSKHNIAEDIAAEMVAKYYGVRRYRVQLPHIFGGASSALLSGDETPMPNLTYKEIDEGVGPSPTVVPFRNANMLSVATTLAITHQCDFVYSGVHAEDAHHWAYPDCTFEFSGAMANAIYVGSYHKVRLIVPLQWMMKADVVYCSLKLAVPINYTWSCYNPVAAPESWSGSFESCGLCPTCVERIEAFRANGVIDPIAYNIKVDWSGARKWDGLEV